MASDRKLQAAIVLSLLTALCPSALALNPSLDINQYAHTAWTIREGHFKGAVFSIAQTADGYLWLGTEFGVVRFDGVRFTEWQPPKNQRLPSTYITKLLAARDGSVWIGTDNGLASWKNGNLIVYSEFADIEFSLSAKLWTELYGLGLMVFLPQESAPSGMAAVTATDRTAFSAATFSPYTQGTEKSGP